MRQLSQDSLSLGALGGVGGRSDWVAIAVIVVGGGGGAVDVVDVGGRSEDVARFESSLNRGCVASYVEYKMIYMAWTPGGSE